ncbi:MAG: signal peptide peptidase SppA [Pseudanabaenaceae cyanobacterium]
MVGWFKNRQIARIEIIGPIDRNMRDRTLESLEKVEKQKFPALVVRIDSPGGTVVDSHEIYAALRRLQSKVKVVASFGNIAASGGVYVAMGAPYVMANPGSITGSIGVILRGNNLERLLDKVGVSFKVVKSGPYKDILAFDRPATPEEIAILQQLIDSSFQQFVRVVAEGRRLTEEAVRSFADGRVFTGEQGLELGLVDRLGSEEDARLWAAELAGLDPKTAKFYTIRPPKPLLNRFLPGSAEVWQRLRFELETSGMPLWMWRGWGSC